MTNTLDFKALGKTVTLENFQGLEAIELPQSHTLSDIQFSSDEVTAVCPVTGQPDWYTVQIIFTPLTASIESKSLKLYLQQYKDEGVFAEVLAYSILEDVVKCTRPRAARVRVIQKSRGGITLTASASYAKEMGSIVVPS